MQSVYAGSSGQYLKDALNSVVEQKQNRCFPRQQVIPVYE